jgi:DNA repair protein RecO (recombination protein O)
MQHVKLTGVVLRTVDYGDADRVISLLTEERGKVSAFARGARVSRRRFGGALEPFTLLTVEARERRGSDLLTLESVSVLSGFGGIRGDLARIACAGYACELARDLVRDAEPHPELLALLVAYLGRLHAAAARPGALRAYELAALQAAGLMPRLSGCVRCGTRLESGLGGGAPPGGAARVTITFDPAEGGVLCEGCTGRGPSAALRLSAGALGALGRLQAGGLPASDAEAISPALGAELKDALSRFIEHHLGHRLASRKFLDEVGPLLGT